MKMQEITNFLDKKIEKDSEFIKITFFELRIKMNLTEEETETFIEFSKTRLKNLGYKTFETGEKYIIENKEKTVERNELVIATKNNKNI